MDTPEKIANVETASQRILLSLSLKNSDVLITGAAGQIGFVVMQYFLAAGAIMTAWDIDDSKMDFKHDRLFWDHVDITDETQVESASQRTASARGVVSICIALARLDISFVGQHASLCDVPLEQWKHTLDVNVNGPFLTARAWLCGIQDAVTQEILQDVCPVRLRGVMHASHKIRS